MEIALPRLPTRARAFWDTVSRSSAVGAVALALFTSALTYALTTQQNHEAAVQQQRLAALQTFIESGSKLDASVTDLVDSVGDRTDVIDAKKETRQALAAHAAASQSIEPIVGKANVEAYLGGVGTLRTIVDETANPSAALTTSQARFDVMHNRTVIVAEARKRIFS